MRYQVNYTRTEYQVIDTKGPCTKCFVFTTKDRTLAIAKVQTLNGLTPADGRVRTYANQVVKAKKRRVRDEAQQEPKRRQGSRIQGDQSSHEVCGAAVEQKSGGEESGSEATNEPGALP